MTTQSPETSVSVLQAAFDELSETGWHALTMAAVATRAAVTLATVHRHIPGKACLFTCLARHVDRVVLNDTEDDLADETPRDRLFDILMRRFDALAPFKPGLVRAVRDLRGDPATVLGSAPQFLCSMGWMLDAARIPGAGMMGFPRQVALGVAYLSTARVWLKEEADDLPRTMAQLDRSLERLEQLATRTSGRRGNSRGAASTISAENPASES